MVRGAHPTSLFVPTPDDADYVVGKKALPTLQGFSQKTYRAIPERVVMPDRRGEVIRAW